MNEREVYVVVVTDGLVKRHLYTVYSGSGSLMKHYIGFAFFTQ